ncbi:MAG TPA: hypothetical protein ENL16_00850 [Candidatus Woesearchaeota archaeon]|nr:hypothetical protein [Candidatus Woesearchaeota archaeon]
MKKNTPLLSLAALILGILLYTSTASAYTYSSYPDKSIYGYSYGPWPQKTLTSYTSRYPYPATPVRVGGFFGANSAYIIGLRPGTYYPTPAISRPAMYYKYSPYRIGGWFGYVPGYTGYYYGLRLGSYYNYGTRYTPTPYMYHGPL